MSYRSGMPGSKDMAVQLGIRAAWVVGHEGKLGINGPGGGQRYSTQSVSHQECLKTVKVTHTVETQEMHLFFFNSSKLNDSAGQAV